MPLTDAEKLKLRAQWRQLVAVVDRRDREALKALAGQALDWRSPSDAVDEAFLYFAFARMAHAWARTRSEADRRMRRRALVELASLVDHLTVPPPPSPQLPFRADLDG